MAAVVGVQAQAPVGACPNRPVRLVVSYAPDVTPGLPARNVKELIAIAKAWRTAVFNSMEIFSDRISLHHDGSAQRERRRILRAYPCRQPVRA